jgi:tight adherence protein C
MSPALKEFLGSLGHEVANYWGKFGQDHVERLRKQLLAAGEPDELKGVELFGIQIVLAFVFPIFWGIIFNYFEFTAFLVEGPKQVLTYSGLAIVGFMFPAANIAERAKQRQKSVALQLPDTLDLLTISVEAGLDLMGAMRRVVEKHRPGALKEELERFFKQTELGRQKRVALREMADRVQLQDMSALVSALIQADRLGVSVGPILRAQSDMLRIRRGQRAEKAAQEAPVKMLAPLMICILPSVFIMILGPVIIKMIIDSAH